LAAENTAASAKKIRKLALEIVQLIPVYNLELFCACNGFGVLLKALVTKEIDDNKLAASIFYTLIQNLMDEETSRNALINSCAFDVVFKTYLQYQVAPVDSKVKIPSDREHFESLEQAVLANDFVKKTLQSPVGLFFFLENPSHLQTTFELLRQRCIEREVKRVILRLADDLLVTQPTSLDTSSLHTLRLKLLLSCNLHTIVFEISQQEEFEDRAKEILQALTKSCSIYLPVKDRPNANFLCHLFTEDFAGVNPPFPQNCTNDFGFSSSLGGLNKIKDGVIVSKINSILDNNFTENFYGASVSSDQRRNAFLFPIEDLYCNTKNSFRDTRTAKKYPWTGLSLRRTANQLELSALLENLPEKWTSWDLELVDQLLETFLKDKSHLSNKLQRPFFRRFLSLFLNEELINLPWNLENFKLLKSIYKFLEALLGTDDEAASLLKTNVAENPFKPYESFMKKIKSLFGPGRNILKGATIRLPKNCTFQHSTDDPPLSVDGPSRLSYVISEQSFMQGNKIIRQKTVDYEEFDVFQVTMLREYIAIIAFMTFFPRGVALLAEYKVFEAIKAFCKKSAKYWQAISIFLLTANHECSEVQLVMVELLTNNSEFMQKATISVLHLLILAEHYEIVLKFVGNLLALLKICSDTLRLLIFDILRRIVLETNHDVAVLKRMSVAAILSSTEFLDAVLRKEEAVKYLNEKGIIDKIYTAFVSGGGPSKVFESFRNASPKEGPNLDSLFADTQDYCYPHYPLHNRQFLSESGVFLASVLRYPWGIRVTQIKDDSRVKAMVYCQATYDPIAECIEVVAKISDEISAKFSEMSERGKDWRLMACVFISNSMVNESLEMVSEDNFFRESKVTAENITLLESDIVAKNNGVEFVFRRSQALDQALILRQVCLRVYMKPKKKAETEARHLSFFELLCQTQTGAEFLQKENAIADFFERIGGDEDVEDQRCSLYCLGLIGKTHHGSQQLLLDTPKVERILNQMYTQTSFLSLKADIHIMANMIAQSEGGQQVLRGAGWQVEFLSKKLLPVVKTQVVATFAATIDRKSSHTLRASNRYQNLILTAIGSITEKDPRSPVRSLVDVLHSAGKSRPKKLYQTLEEAVDLFVFCVGYLSMPSDFSSSNRQFLWSIVDELVRTPEVSAALDKENRSQITKFMENV
jgi:hypothetical protein